MASTGPRAWPRPPHIAKRLDSGRKPGQLQHLQRDAHPWPPGVPSSRLALQGVHHMPQQLRPRFATLAPKVRPATVANVRRMPGDAWMRLRARILARDCGQCQACKRAGRLALACEVDHVQPLAEGGSDDPGNLESICRDCHAAKTAADRLRMAGAS